MTHVLQAEPRVALNRGALSKLRASRKIPAAVYGPEMAPVSVTVEYNPFEKTFHASGSSSLIELNVAGKKINALVKDFTTHPVSGKFTHVDFYAVSMTKELETEAHLEFVGESDTVKNQGGTLVKVKDSLAIRCLPASLVHHIEVALDKLKTFDDVITVADITPPAGITFLDEPDAVVAKVSAPLTEDQLKALEAENAADVTKVEVVGKKEDAETAVGAEGAAATGAKAEAKKGDAKK